MLKANFIKKFTDFKLDISLEVAESELLVILGKSGCGKSTLLNCLAGFIRPDVGSFDMAGKCYNQTENNFMLAIHKRHIAYIQQGNTLFPHLSVGENILYSVRKKKRALWADKYEALLDLLDINMLMNRSVETLSGGQKQRVIIARALMMDPGLVLWDEPFTALDHQLREELSNLVLALKKQLKIPMIFVTHDLEEAFKMADSLAVMHEGHILQLDDKSRIFNHPCSERVAQTLGIKNRLYVRCMDERKALFEHTASGHTFEVRNTKEYLNQDYGHEQVLGIRPESITLIPSIKDGTKTNTFSVTLMSKEEKLNYYQLTIKLKGIKDLFIMHLPKDHVEDMVDIGEKMSVYIKAKDMMIFEK